MSDSHEIFKVDKHVTVLNNSNFMEPELNLTLKKVDEMMIHKAYLHQYAKYGLEVQDFYEAIAFNEQINYDYMNN